MGRLQGVTVNIEGVSMQEYFEVIEIVNDNNPYLVLLGIEWATDMNIVINLKRCKMIFEKKSLRVVVLLDLAKGARYTEPLCDNNSDDDLDCIYKITTREEYCVNPIINGRISWDHKISCTLDLEKDLE